MALIAGQKLGPYEILAAIGAGGMGEVYRARDERLKRDVAIKVLPAAYSADPERLRRFEQEAQAAGALNHPNITAVHDFGSHEGAPYIVTELLEGETLRSRLAGGPFTPRRAIGHALQLAQGLAAAHEKGIVHRDLKPENVFVTNDGRVKILDFGLAKLTQPEGLGASQTNLPTASPETEPGRVMGTVGYMSPEQVRGKFVDARSDIFAFGAILYEMLAGKRAFHEDTTADTMSAILTKEPPDLSETDRRVPESLDRIVRHCLEKSPEARFQSAADVAFNLEALSEASLSSGAQPVSSPRPRRLLVPAAITLALIAGAALSHWLWRSPVPSLPNFRRLTFRRGNLASARFTPDGNSIVYAASWDGKPLEIFTARLDGLESTALGLRNSDVLSVSRSGELAISIREGFLAGPFGVGTLARVPLTGGAPRPVLHPAWYADWSPDGKDLAITREHEGQRVVEYPIGTVRYKTPNWLFSPRVSPRGDRIALVESGFQGYEILIVNLNGQPQHLPKGGAINRLAWAARSDEVFFDENFGGGQMMISAIDLRGRKRLVARIPDGLTLMDVSADGRVLLERFVFSSSAIFRTSGSSSERDLGWFDVTNPVAISQNGELLLLQVWGDAGGASGSFHLRRTDGSAPVKLGDGIGLDLSRDGTKVLAFSGDGELMLVPTGPGTPVRVSRGNLKIIDFGAFLPGDNRLIVAARESPSAPRRLYVLESAAGAPRPAGALELGGGTILTGVKAVRHGDSMLIFHDFDHDLYLVPIAGGAQRAIPGTRGLEPITEAQDGRSFFASEIGSIPLRVFKVDMESGARTLVHELAPSDMTGVNNLSRVVMTPDGGSYAFGFDRSATSDLYLVEGLK